MPTDSDDEPLNPSAESPDARAPGSTRPKAPQPIERSRFGGTERRQERTLEDDAPVSRSDLSRGPQELLEHREARINWSVLLISSVLILAFSVWAILTPGNARVSMKGAVDWIAMSLGWYYVVTMALVIGFVLWVALSKEGSVRLGPDHSRPQYGLVTWVAMLFAAGVGIDMLFYSVTGPVVQYMYPPSGDSMSLSARQDAVVWTMFHYGIAGWSMYALLGMSMGYFAYRWACRCPSGPHSIPYSVNAYAVP